MNGVVSRPGQRWLSSGGLTLIADAAGPQDDGGHSCNTLVRCRIVSLDRGRLLVNRSNCAEPCRACSQRTTISQSAAHPCSTSPPCRSCAGRRGAGRRSLRGTSRGGHLYLIQHAEACLITYDEVIIGSTLKGPSAMGWLTIFPQNLSHHRLAEVQAGVASCRMADQRQTRTFADDLGVF